MSNNILKAKVNYFTLVKIRKLMFLSVLKQKANIDFLMIDDLQKLKIRGQWS